MRHWTGSRILKIESEQESPVVHRLDRSCRYILYHLPRKNWIMPQLAAVRRILIFARSNSFVLMYKQSLGDLIDIWGNKYVKSSHVRSHPSSGVVIASLRLLTTLKFSLVLFVSGDGPGGVVWFVSGWAVWYLGCHEQCTGRLCKRRIHS